MAHSVKPPKPANQGGKAPAYVQPPNAHVASVEGTANMPHRYSPSAGWEQHAEGARMPGGTSGKGKGAR